MEVLKVATVQYEPFMVFNATDKSWTGTCKDILDRLARDLNLTFDIFEVDGWGNLVNNSWDGMIGAVVSGEADMAGN